MNSQQLNNAFTQHPLSADQTRQQERILVQARAIGQTMIADVPDCPEREQAFNYLQQCVMWNQAAISYGIGGGEGTGALRSQGSAGRS